MKVFRAAAQINGHYSTLKCTAKGLKHCKTFNPMEVKGTAMRTVAKLDVTAVNDGVRVLNVTKW